MSTRELLNDMLRARLQGGALAWFEAALGEEARGARFDALFSSASRHARDRTPLAPTEAERLAAACALEGWNPERWTLLEALRVALLLSRPDLGTAEGTEEVLELFRYADEGEQRALYRSLAHLPDPEAFRWRAGEGCRTNMVNVFEAVVLDTPYPVRFFDEVAWCQAVIKCVFIGAPLWRLWGLDERLGDDLARMALDLMDERRSARREVQPELWACLGAFGGERALRSIETELAPANPHVLGRRAAALALARAGQRTKLEERLRDERDPEVADTMRQALGAVPDSTAFGALRPEET